MKEGDILRIDRHGRYTVEQFDTSNLWNGAMSFGWPHWDVYAEDTEYVRDLKSIAPAYGYDPRDIDAFLHYGMCPEEIEELRWVTPAQLTEELRTTPERFASWFLTAAPMVLRFLE